MSGNFFLFLSLFLAQGGRGFALRLNLSSLEASTVSDRGRAALIIEQLTIANTLFVHSKKKRNDGSDDEANI